MGSIHKQGVVHAPPTAVYAYVADVAHAPHYITAFTHVLSGPEPPGPPAVGQRWRVQAAFLGNTVPLGLRLAQLESHRQVQLALEGNPSGLITIHLTPEAGGAATAVSVTLDAPAFNNFMLNMVMGSMLDDSLHRLNRALTADSA
jgi:ribosome-associated toxin RatA of RatAB toxin-antitoxin module